MSKLLMLSIQKWTTEEIEALTLKVSGASIKQKTVICMLSNSEVKNQYIN